jgi:hypothetical protein
MTNKAKYILVNGDYVMGIVYESDTYGRTLVLERHLNPNYPLQIHEIHGNPVIVKDVDLMEFIHSLLPK